MTDAGAQFGRKASLILTAGGTALDLSTLHFRFNVQQQDVESPNNAVVRIYNLSDDTMRQIRGEFDTMTLQAGYENNYGVIFQGSIKQFRIGRESPTDRFLELMAADGDLAYNFSVVSNTLASGWTQVDAINAAATAMKDKGLTLGTFDQNGLLGGTIPNPRGKVMFGLPRVMLRIATKSTGSSWSIDSGKIVITPLDSYQPGEVVVLTSKTGLIGLPEQTADGIIARSLLNPRLTVGGLVKIDNDSVQQIVQKTPLQEGSNFFVPYNKRAALQNVASVAADGLYRIFVAEYEGDTRGQAWYSNLVCLAVNQATQKVVRPNG